MVSDKDLWLQEQTVFLQRRHSIILSVLADFTAVLKKSIEQVGPIDAEHLERLCNKFQAYTPRYFEIADRNCTECLHSVPQLRINEIEKRIREGKDRRCNFLSRLLVLGTIGHFENPSKRIPPELISGVVKFLRMYLGKNRFAELNVQCKALMEQAKVRSNQHSFKTLCEDAVYGYILSDILVQILLLLPCDVGKDRFLKVLRATVGRDRVDLVPDSTFDRVFYSWFWCMRDWLASEDIRKHLAAKHGPDMLTKASEILDAYWPTLVYPPS